MLQKVPRQQPVQDDWPVASGVLPIKNYRRLRIHQWAAALAIGDLIGSIAFAGVAIRGLGMAPQQTWASVGSLMLVWSLVAYSQELYTRVALMSGLRAQLAQSAVTVGLGAGLVLLLTFSLGVTGDVYRSWLAAWAAGTLAWMCALRVTWRQCLRVLLRRGECLDRALMFTGSAERAAVLSESVERDTRGEVRVVAAAQIPYTPGGPSLDWVENVIRMGLVDRVFVAAFDNSLVETNLLLTRLGRLAVDVTIVPNMEGIDAPTLRVDQIGPRPVIDVNLVPLSAMRALAKRTEDLVIASLALVLLAPFLALIAIAIKLDSPGPVFFRQWRAGFHDRRFRMWKFRTMYHNMRDEGAIRQTTRTDNRITYVGRILRQTSLDELPQLLNVLVGEMSIVGPRPHALGMTATGEPLHEVAVDYSSRHRVRPGITGWAQVSDCRGEVDTKEKLRRRVMLDCYYIEHWSFGFDLWIIMRTAVQLLIHRNAY
jgi:polysaccharide biosynthesis protein PslA